jgi:hypothetical protein
VTAGNYVNTFLAVWSGSRIEEILVQTGRASGGVVASVTAFDLLVANVAFFVHP